jgi:aspartate aminotransferase
MSTGTRPTPVLADVARDPGPLPERRVGSMATGLMGSEILKIAGEIRALVAAGQSVCDLTVGDFSPKQFPIPARLREAIRAALDRGETNYPPSTGILELRQAVRRFYAARLGLDYPLESILVAGGSRPITYTMYRALVDPGDRVVYPVPSWNNNHYVHMAGAVGVPVPCGPETRFMPTRDALREALPGARLLCLNSPLNPAGTAIDRDALLGVCEAILAENEAREGRGERPLYLLYDQVYWMLCFGDTRHLTPPGLLPEMARYTIIVDGISKAFAATGLRVGWGLGPADLMGRMAAILGHVGAWAPRPEQVATAAFLDDAESIRAFNESFVAGLERRLDRLHAGLQSLKAEGLPVDSVPPMGAIYLAARIHPFGRRTAQGAELRTNEDIRRFLLAAAGVGVVPFQAFGTRGEDGWFRMSVGAVGESDIAAALPRLAAVLRSLQS